MTTAVKERPIIFSAPMVRAILDGRKTQTRRIIKPQPKSLGDDCWRFRDRKFISSEVLKDHLFHDVYGGDDPAMPYGGVYEGYGDRLWVRETWGQFWGGIHYRATDDRSEFAEENWKPAIYMPRRASRITLEITDVRVERVQEIYCNTDDLLAEGVKYDASRQDGDPGVVFRKLWDEINGAGSWAANPWVWVIGFKRVEEAS